MPTRAAALQLWLPVARHFHVSSHPKIKQPSLISSRARKMNKQSHEERTATEPREADIHPVILHKLAQPVQHIRLIQLQNANPATPIKASMLLYRHAENGH